MLAFYDISAGYSTITLKCNIQYIEIKYERIY